MIIVTIRGIKIERKLRQIIHDSFSELISFIQHTSLVRSLISNCFRILELMSHRSFRGHDVRWIQLNGNRFHWVFRSWPMCSIFFIIVDINDPYFFRFPLIWCNECNISKVHSISGRSNVASFHVGWSNNDNKYHFYSIRLISVITVLIFLIFCVYGLYRLIKHFHQSSSKWIQSSFFLSV